MFLRSKTLIVLVLKQIKIINFDFIQVEILNIGQNIFKIFWLSYTRRPKPSKGYAYSFPIE